jgi:hypothetical protein
MTEGEAIIPQTATLKRFLIVPQLIAVSEIIICKRKFCRS